MHCIFTRFCSPAPYTQGIYAVSKCPSSVVCFQQFALNEIISDTTGFRALIFDIKNCLVNLYQVC